MLKRTRYGLISGIFLALYCLFPVSVSACQCFQTPPPCVAFEEADAVFSGKAISITPIYDKGFNVGVRRIKFSTKQSFKGVEGATVVLDAIPSSCETFFEKGEEYLVYAYRDEEDKSLGTSSCTRTTLLDSADEDLAYLKRTNSDADARSIAGLIRDNGVYPVNNLQITLQGEEKLYSTATDGDGRFRIVVEPGKYLVRFAVPRKSSVLIAPYRAITDSIQKETSAGDEMEYEINLRENQCAFLDVRFFVSNSSPK